MRKITTILLIILSIIIACISCTTDIHDPGNITYIQQDSIETQEFFNRNIKETVITNKQGHQIILYEKGERLSRYYRFSIEHSPTCQKCYDIFD